MTRYRLQLAIRYEFDRPGGGGRQLFRVLPADLPGRQRLLSAAVTLQPDPSEQGRFSDFFGTPVLEAAIPAGLSEFDLQLAAEVERVAPPPGPDLSLPLPDLAAALAADRGLGPLSPQHFRTPSQRIPPDAEIAAFARQAAGSGRTLRQVTEAVGLALHAHMAFDAEATNVDTPPAEAFAAGRGVCQDFAQIMVGGLRSLGVPAAYVAGYLRTLPPPGQPRLVGADAMHAWVRAWAGPVAGWIDYDPTNACFVAADHVDVGFGRDYGDVAPVTGMLRLEGLQSGHHSVDIAEIPS